MEFLINTIIMKETKKIIIKHNGQFKEITLFFNGVKVYFKEGGWKQYKSLAIAKRFLKEHNREDNVKEIKNIYSGYLFNNNNYPIKNFVKEYDI